MEQQILAHLNNWYLVVAYFALPWLEVVRNWVKAILFGDVV